MLHGAVTMCIWLNVFPEKNESFSIIMKDVESQIKYIDEKLLPLYGVKNIIDYDKRVISAEISADALRLLNIEVQNLQKYFNRKLVNLDSSHPEIKTQTKAFSLLRSCLESASVPYELYYGDKGIVLRLIPENLILKKYRMNINAENSGLYEETDVDLTRGLPKKVLCGSDEIRKYIERTDAKRTYYKITATRTGVRWLANKVYLSMFTKKPYGADKISFFRVLDYKCSLPVEIQICQDRFPLKYTRPSDYLPYLGLSEVFLTVSNAGDLDDKALSEDFGMTLLLEETEVQGQTALFKIETLFANNVIRVHSGLSAAGFSYDYQRGDGDIVCDSVRNVFKRYGVELADKFPCRGEKDSEAPPQALRVANWIYGQHGDLERVHDETL
jgi:hypothetical protein